MNTSKAHPLLLDDPDLLRDCNVSRTRRSGPGGQHRNKVESAIVIEHKETSVVAEANERRSQHENKKEALFRLRIQIALAVRGPKIDSDMQSRWKQRIHAQKISINPSHEDFPILLAHALDVICLEDFEVKEAANQLEISTSQLIKFLKLENKALQWVNAQRQKLGLPKLK